MKLNNLELALALADHVLTTSGPQYGYSTELLQLADYLATHPTSSVFYERTLGELGIDPHTVPSESWTPTIPTEGEGAAALKEAITNLNQQWHVGKLQRRVAVRALAWAAQLLARRLDADCEQDCKDVVARNGGSTAGLFRKLISTTATRAELQAAQETRESAQQSLFNTTENQNEPATAA
jgi:hypothetical protein